MLATYLYNTRSKELSQLDEAGLLACAPAPEEAARKQALPDKGLLTQGKTQCRPDEFIWVDVTNPTEEELKLVMQRFTVHPMVLEDIKSREDRPKLHDYDDYLYIIFHAISIDAQNDSQQADSLEKNDTSKEVPALTKTDASEIALRDTSIGARCGVRLCEIDCLVGSDYVVTIHGDPVRPFDDLRNRWQRHPDLMQAGTAYLLYELMDEVLDDYFPVLDTLDERIDEFEDRLFMDYQGNLSSDIFSLKRALLQIRRVAGPTRDVVNTLLRHNAETGGQHFAYFQDLYDHAVRIVDMIDTFREILSGALDAYLAIESNRTNAVMKTLTATSIMLLVPNLIAAIYGMNFKNMPELESPSGYYFALAIMANVVLLLFAYFRRKEWL